MVSVDVRHCCGYHDSSDIGRLDGTDVEISFRAKAKVWNGRIHDHRGDWAVESFQPSAFSLLSTLLQLSQSVRGRNHSIRALELILSVIHVDLGFWSRWSLEKAVCKTVVVAIPPRNGGVGIVHVAQGRWRTAG
jgi:hypothetical protein